MPLGDPGGGNFVYTDEGLPISIFAAAVPVKDVKRALAFYTEVLGMEIIYSNETEAAVYRGGARLILRKSQETGTETGIILGVDNPYDFHRRLVDEGVVFVSEPKRLPLGVCTSFRDDDGNILHAMETGAEPRP